MARPKVKLNHAGLAAILQSGEMRALVDEAAAKVVSAAQGQGVQVNGHHGEKVDLPVTVTAGTSDRARSTVALAHPAGEAVQAKYGTLTKAAAAAGLEVRAK